MLNALGPAAKFVDLAGETRSAPLTKAFLCKT